VGIGTGLYMYSVVVSKFTFAILSPDEFLVQILLISRQYSVEVTHSTVSAQFNRMCSTLYI